MLKCRDVAREASDFIDHRIPWHQRPGWYLHLLLCHHCRRFIRHLRTSVRVAAGQPKQTASAEEVSKILGRCTGENHRHD